MGETNASLFTVNGVLEDNVAGHRKGICPGCRRWTEEAIHQVALLVDEWGEELDPDNRMVQHIIDRFRIDADAKPGSFVIFTCRPDDAK